MHSSRYISVIFVSAILCVISACSDIHRGQWTGPGDVSDSDVDVLAPADIVDVSGQDLFKPDTHGKDVTDNEGVDINHVDVPADADVQIGRDIPIDRDIKGDADAVTPTDTDVPHDADALADTRDVPETDVSQIGRAHV